MLHLSAHRLLLFLVLLLTLPTALRAQTWQWVVGTTANPQVPQAGYVYAQAVTLDGAGNTIVVGSFAGTVTLGATTLTSLPAPGPVTTGPTEDIFVGWLNAQGQWTRAVQAGSNGTDRATAVALDAAGNVVVAGTVAGTTATFGSFSLPDLNQGQGLYNDDIVVARLSPAGVWTQAVRSDGDGGGEPAAANAVVVDGNGNVVVAGNFSDRNLRFGSITLTKPYISSRKGVVAWLSAAGQWTRAVPVGSDVGAIPQCLALASNGEVVVAGNFQNTQAFGATTLGSYNGSTSLFVGRLSTAGLWTQAVAAGSSVSSYPTSMCLAPSGEIVVAGSFNGQQTSFGPFTLHNVNATFPSNINSDIYVARLSPAGTWTQAVAAGSSEYDYVSALALAPSGDAVVAGSFNGLTLGLGSFALANGAGPPPTYGSRSADVFVARLSGAGTWVQALRGGGPEEEGVRGMAWDGQGGLTLVGDASGSTVFGPFALSRGTRSYVAHLAGLVTSAKAGSPAEAISLAPNPARQQAQLTWATPAPTARTLGVFDGLGRLVREQPVPAQATTASLNVRGLVPGLYLVRCGTAVSRLVVE
jgi:hypothetical protein